MSDDLIHRLQIQVAHLEYHISMNERVSAPFIELMNDLKAAIAELIRIQAPGSGPSPKQIYDETMARIYNDRK